MKIKPFLLTEASQEVELDDVYRGTFLNICMTLRHEQEGKDKSVINAAYEVVSHSVFPESLFNEIQEVRFKFKGLDFISWEDVVGPLYEVRAQGELTIAKSQKDESYKLPYWPNSNQLTLQFTDRRQNKSDFLYYSAALNLSDFNGFVFVQNIEKTYQNFDEFRDILNSQNRKWLADLGKKSCVKDYAESGKLQIAVTAQLHMKKQNETEFIPLNFVLLSHQILPWEIQEVKDITILLTEVKIFTQNGIQTPVKYQVVLLHNDGIEKRFMNDTKWTVQRSYQ
ncbi:hypothetical protein [Candidatus Bealeia paramacronuclearis]|uniref:hypothetical protein n=1 Tax=Candidatus Bealeia paramacronuclearis TaxID=1921001 RepID=UPI002F26C1F1